jgi:glycosyltransferase involved in cell wall biosynthesis
MRILRLYYLLPPIKGGMEKHIYFLSKYQSSENYVNIYFNKGDKINSDDVRILPNFSLHKTKPNSIGVLIFHFFTIFKLIRNNSKFDVVHVHGDWSALLLISLIKKITKSKVVAFSIHDQLVSSFKKKVLSFLIKQVDLIFTSGADSANYLKPHKPNAVFFQPSGISAVFLDTPSNKVFSNNVIIIANLVPKKNIDLVIEIAKICPDYNFKIVGKGPEKQRLETKMQNIDNVSLVGFKTTQEIITLMDNSFAFLLTSFFEGTPTSVLEACSRGLPIVTSNVGGLKSIIKDNENGYVIDNYDPSYFKNALDKIYNTPDMLELMKINNCLLGEKFVWDNVAKNITNQTKKILKNKLSC